MPKEEETEKRKEEKILGCGDYVLHWLRKYAEDLSIRKIMESVVRPGGEQRVGVRSKRREAKEKGE